MIDEDLHLGQEDPGREQLTNRQTLNETVNYIGSKVREVEKRHREALEADGFDFNIHLIVGGQIKGFAPEVHLIYPQGNSIHATLGVYPAIAFFMTSSGPQLPCSSPTLLVT